MAKERKSAYLLIAHGTREKEGENAFFQFVEEFRHVFPHRNIQPAFLELSRPAIPEAIQSCIQAGAEAIFVLPLMLFPGRHINQDIPRFIQEAKQAHPEVDFHYAGALALGPSRKGTKMSEPKMLDLLRTKIAGLEGD